MKGALKAWGKGFETRFKRGLRAALRLTLPRREPASGALEPGAVGRILVVRQDSRLGNLLLLTPLLKGIKTAFPAAAVDVLISEAYGEVYRNNPCITRLLVLPKKVVWPEPARPFRLLRELRERRYDLAFDASHMHAFSLTSAVLSSLSGARQLVGYERGDAGLFLNRLVRPPSLPRHEMDILLTLLRAVAPWAGLPEAEALKPEYYMSPEEKEDGEGLWNSWGADKETVAIFLGGRGDKRWETPRFLELAEELSRGGRRCALFAGPAERSLLSNLKLPRGSFLAPPLPLRAFAAVIANARAVVSADSGPMHLAVAAGAPTVEIFMNSDAWRFGYAHLAGHRVVDAAGRRASVAEVLSALESLPRL